MVNSVPLGSCKVGRIKYHKNTKKSSIPCEEADYLVLLGHMIWLLTLLFTLLPLYLIRFQIGPLPTTVLEILVWITAATWIVPHSFWANRNTYRVTGWYGFPNGVGLLLAPLIPIAIYLGSEFRKKTSSTKNNYAVLSLVVLFVLLSPLAIVYSKTTAAMVGLTAGLGILLLCFKKTRIPAIILGILGIIGLILLPNNPVTNELLAKDYSGQLRRDIWTETITYLKIHPILGTGVAGYSTEIAPFRTNKKIEVFHHPHNIGHLFSGCSWL